MTEREPAASPMEAFWALDPYVLVDPTHSWYTDLEQFVGREHYGVAQRLRRHLAAAPGRAEFVHVALLGHPGTGKATLVRRAMQGLSSEGLCPVYIDALQSLDQTEFTFSDLVLITAEAVMGDAEVKGLLLEQTSLDSVRQWFAEELLTESHRNQLLSSIETKGEGGLNVPFLAKISAKIAAALKSDHEYRREIRRRGERDPRELIRRANALLDAVHAAYSDRKLCVVFDNLEKAPIELVHKALLQRAEEFRKLRINAILFCNPASEYSPVHVQVSRAFTLVEVPALPVRQPGDSLNHVRPEALDAIHILLSKRIRLGAVFQDPDACVLALARNSGGHLRDLLRIARRAVEDVEPNKVTESDIEKAARWLGAGLTSTLRPEDLPRAVEIHETHHVLDTEQDRRMLKNSCVLQYDGTRWWDVHPAIQADPLFIAAKDNRAKAQ